jgi:hypothetical protein
MMAQRALHSWAILYFHFSTLLRLPDLFSFVQSIGKPLLHLLVTTFVESIGLWYRECAAANTGIIPSWWQVHDAVVKRVTGKMSQPTLQVRAQCEKIQTFDQPLLID